MSQLQQDCSSLLTNIAALAVYATALRVTDVARYERVFGVPAPSFAFAIDNNAHSVGTTDTVDPVALTTGDAARGQDAAAATKVYWMTICMLAGVELLACMAFCLLVSTIWIVYLCVERTQRAADDLNLGNFSRRGRTPNMTSVGITSPSTTDAGGPIRLPDTPITSAEELRQRRNPEEGEDVMAYTMAHSTAGICFTTMLHILPLMGIHPRNPRQTGIPNGKARHFLTVIIKLFMLVVLIKVFPQVVGLGYVGDGVGWTGVVVAAIADISSSVTAESENKPARRTT
ncbi:uncharacterized protein EV422DRAFT_531028 [Fimicolochytrium jonesii]|uniref:uncharacterized protein n=1 Tax=Fimicolochytrium jonesii TaxID=1396493 RepID=UPI0022FDC015|nr:uncharacterized protein EV422DRAFT_531028 [Fimicolochytrium jonesii]KAI8820482.1 hypothetical protein EV422DRAFT_531028 [Fimicolochytrium jonesii]